ncbi:hypothetical protein V2G26_018082 [Clonostachys chloroleuca]
MSEGTEYSFLGLRGERLNWLVIFVAGFEFLLFGYDQGVMGGLLTLPSFTKVFPEICTTKACFEGLSASARSTMSTTQGIAISSYNLGCFCGALLAAFIGDRLGRRKTILLGCILVTIGAILQFSGYELPQFVVGRVICGFGTGLNTATVPIWQAECLQPHRRGPVMAFQTSLVIAGVMVSYWLDFGLSYAEPSQVAWRFPIAFQLVFSLFIIASIMFLPESPRWLMLKDKQEEAAATISALYDLPRNDPLVSEQLSAIYKTVHVDTNKNFMAMLSQGHLKKRTRTFIAVAVHVLSQLSGINIITFYAASIYENEIGLSPFLSRILAACNGTQYFLASVFSVPLVKNFGRRPLLLFSSTGMCLSMVVLAICTKIGGTQAGIGAAVFLFVFNTFFGLAYAQISWLLAAEVVALPVRAQANALATSSNWIATLTYLIFASFNFLGLPIIYFLFPETWGRSLEEIDLIFTGSKNIFDAIKRSQTMERHFDKKGNLIAGLAVDVEQMPSEGGELIKDIDVQHVESPKM